MKNILFVIIIAFSLLTCGTTKDLIDFKEVRQGYLLDKANEIELGDFLIIWIENTNFQPKVDFGLNELFKDSTYTYFGKQTFKYQKLYKIRNNYLIRVDYKSINGDFIRMKFLDEVIPQEDKNRVSRKMKNCTSSFTSYDYNYRYVESDDQIEIQCLWKVKCDFLYNLIKKEYRANYDITKSKFIKA